MATNLIVNHGWRGFLFDGSDDLVETGRIFFANHLDTWLHPPVFRQAWITAENVNDALHAAGLTGEVDLLSLDVDGMEYWLWKALTAVTPRVVICEMQNCIPSHLALTAPYSPDFAYMSLPEEIQDFRGASLLAMQKLASEIGYRLVGAHGLGFNSIFVRNDEGLDRFPEVTVEFCHDNDYTQTAHRERWPKVRHCPWVEI